MDERSVSRAMKAGHLRRSHRTPIPIPHPIRWLAVVGVVLYLIAPWFTALNLVGENGDPTYYPGWTLLFFGWIGVISSSGGDSNAFGWLANPCFVFGFLALALGRRGVACGFMLAAALISLMSFWLLEVPINEAGGMAKVVGHDIGFWIWISAIWFSPIISLLVWLLPMSDISAESRHTESEIEA